LAWLRRDVEPSSFAQDPEWKLAAGSGSSLAAELSKSADDAERFRQRSRSVFQDVIAGWPDSSYAMRAYLNLTALALDVHERISFLRYAWRIEPNRVHNITFLANALASRGSASDLKEAADLYRSAYESGSRRNLGFASNAMDLYASIGQPERAAALKAQVARDSGMATFEEEIATGRLVQDLKRATEVVETACHNSFVKLFGRQNCANALDSLVAATRRRDMSAAERQSLASIAVEGMGMLRIADDGRFGETKEQLSERYFQLRTILQEWIEAGIAPAAAYVFLARLPSASDPWSDDLNESVSAFERAVELAPDNGRYRYWLALGYIEQGRFDEANQHLRMVRDSLAENAEPSRESVDFQIRRTEIGMLRRQP
jgi:tetratricopeptide (TPR) repeat protein